MVEFFYSPLFNSLTTLIVGFFAIYLYIKQKKDNKREAALAAIPFGIAGKNHYLLIFNRLWINLSGSFNPKRRLYAKKNEKLDITSLFFSLFAFSTLPVEGAKKTNNKKKPIVTPQIDINRLVKNGVSTCFNAYVSNFDRAIAQESERLVGMGALHSSAAKLIPVTHAKAFAEAIINQISSLTINLSPVDNQKFWNLAAQEIKQVLNNYCKNHGSSSMGDLNLHIDNQIQMKKTFG